MNDDESVCRACGAAQNSPGKSNDNGGFGWGLLGCCIPIVGLVLFLVWREEKPRTAKAAGIGALISVGIAVLWYAIIFLIGLGTFSMAAI